jgi:2-keto-4-pentenoate hydratase/2-oxohepta-3-ene-1,7-dioic acid hydratase in catechol pathway
MRLVRYQAAGATGVGAVRPDGSVVTTPWRDFGALFAEPDPLRAAQALDLSREEPVAVQRLLAPVVDRVQVIGTGGNYADHAAEARTGGLVVTEPVFMPYLWGAVIGPDDDIVIPTEDTQTDYEVELSVVIGQTARGLTEQTAMDAVFGFTIAGENAGDAVQVGRHLPAGRPAGGHQGRDWRSVRSPDRHVPERPAAAAL